MRKIRKTQAALNLPTLTLEGGLFLPDQLEKAALGTAQFQSEADYATPKGLKLKDDYSRAFQIACAQWKHFAAQMERGDLDAATTTQNFVQELLRDAFGYTQIQPVSGIAAGDRHYPVQLLAGQVPMVVAPHLLGLDDADPRFAIAGAGSRKKSAFQLTQELLNASSEHLWGIISNGKALRLLRDAATLTRPSFLEIDLQDLLGGQRFAEFANVWRLIHASRAPILLAGELPGARGQTPANCIWEKWRAAGQEEGARVRAGLRLGVTDALLALGEGFLQHPANDALRTALHTGELSKYAYFQQLLRLIYRFIFLFSVEERGLLHPADESKEALAARRAYAEGYAVARLRDLSLKRRARNRFDDHWQALRIVFRCLSEGEPRLALPALGGLFAPGQCPAVDAASLSNAHLLTAMQQLRWASHKGVLAPVDYRNRGPEEWGSVYESLLELVPDIDLPARKFGFVGFDKLPSPSGRGAGGEGAVKGNARKLTGSYYTPDSLVQELIKSALDPVIEQRLAANPADPSGALLNIRVIDPACGSGHFLLAAACRLAERLAQLQTPEGVVKPQDYRHALREVVARCIFGVDRNPMAIELARTALWLEGFEEGRPLSFLDHHLQVGDALLGLTSLKALELGIAKDAYKPLTGDDKEVCKALAKTNAAALKDLEKKRLAQAFGQLDVAHRADSGLSALQAIEALPEDSARQIADKEAAYRDFLQQAKTSPLAHAADLLLGAYLLPKTAHPSPHAGEGPGVRGDFQHIPTTATLYLTLLGDALPTGQMQALAAAQAACQQARVLHWPLAFPQIFSPRLLGEGTGVRVRGFDCVLGNPPWERIKLQEEEFFATRHRDVAEAKNKAERGQRIQWLSEGMLARHLYPQMDHPPHECEAEQRLYAEFIGARRTAEAASLFAHVKGEDGGRYPLTGVGDVNTYALFAETISQIMAFSPGQEPTDVGWNERQRIPANGPPSWNSLQSFQPTVEGETVPGNNSVRGMAQKRPGVRGGGRAGFIVPTGIATDDSTKAFFAEITQNGRLVSLFDIENRDAVFPAVHRSYKFCLLTLGPAEQAEFVCFASQVHQLADPRRRFRLTPEEFRLINPNTLTCPVFRSGRDAELTKKLYRAAPVLIEESSPRPLGEGLGERANPWGISFMAMMHMSNDSHLFADAPGPGRLPLYEAKMIHQFDHRWATYLPSPAGESEARGAKPAGGEGAEGSRDVTLAEKSDPDFTVTPRYWVREAEVEQRLNDKNWTRGWLMGWRDICRATDERTVIASVVPRVATGDTLLLMFPDPKHGAKAACLLADQCSLVHDYVARQKVGGTHLKYHVKKQLPNLPPDRYSDADLDFIVPRVLELTYTAHDLAPWAEEVGATLVAQGRMNPPLHPYPWNPERRAHLRAELDAYYAKLYGLTRDELRYILDPADVMGEDYPSETFRVLKNNELRQFGEYRTQRLVLAAWDRLQNGELL